MGVYRLGLDAANDLASSEVPISTTVSNFVIFNWLASSACFAPVHLLQQGYLPDCLVVS